MSANMSGEIKNYDFFEQFFFEAEKTFLHSRAKIENENDMESFLIYNKWCKSMAECKEESYYNNSDEKFFFVVVPYCEWQDFEAPALLCSLLSCMLCSELLPCSTFFACEIFEQAVCLF